MSIVTLATYPIERPFHGGQRRVAALHQHARARGLTLHHLPLFFADDFPEASVAEREGALPSDLRTTLLDQGLQQDLHLAHALTLEMPAVARCLASLRAHAPRVVSFEHPWLFPVLGPAIATDPVLSQAKIVYSAHNIESTLVEPSSAADAEALERQIAAEADLVCAVSADDAERLRSWTKAPVIVAGNGAVRPPVVPRRSGRMIPEDYILFTGSAHKPNAEGYWENFGMIPGFLPPGARLVVAGGVNNMLGQDTRFQKFRLMNDTMVHNLGVVSETDLESLLHHARAICLPISSGGGSNLKTAEALVSGKPVVARSHAFRGFEDWMNAPGVFIAETAQDFRRKIAELFLAPHTVQRAPDMTETLLWEHTLAPLLSALEERV